MITIACVEDTSLFSETKGRPDLTYELTIDAEAARLEDECYMNASYEYHDCPSRVPTGWNVMEKHYSR